MERTFRRRVNDGEVVSAELARHLTEISREINRQVAVLIDRKGYVQWVVIGDAQGVHLPGLGRWVSGGSRFNGLRMVHTHLNHEPLNDDDLTDLALLRFDLIAAVCVNDDGLPGRVFMAHLMPPNPDEELYSFLEARDLYHLDFDFLATVSEIEREFERRTGSTKGVVDDRRCLLVGVKFGGEGSNTRTMNELAELADSAGLMVAKQYLQSRFKPDARYLIGRGKLRELILDSMQHAAGLIIFDCALTPAQARSIAAEADVEVLDRNQLILAIFGQRAKSRAGKLQVELASLRYELPRLHERAQGLSRITGGIGALGPGETKLEIHRRRVRDRITKLEREIGKMGKQRELRRRRRQNAQAPVVSIVGYTNAGKSTLLNRMTASDAPAEDRLFATLDPISRRIRLDRRREMVVTDTVGFIRDLPDELTDAFRATLEELEDADLLVHVVDLSNPDHEAQIDSVQAILEQMSLDKIPMLTVYNKCDRLEKDGIEIVSNGDSPLFISAETGHNIETLLNTISNRLWGGEETPEEAFDEAPEEIFDDSL